MNKFFTIITTIQQPTQSVNTLIEKLNNYNGTLVVVGDKKGPESYQLEVRGDHINSKTIRAIQFLDLQNQLDGPFALARKLPTNHYSRKNIGYLHAISQGASCIYETDDDNAPLEVWQPRNEYVNNIHIVNNSRDHRWVNIYRYFSGDTIWPRGLPLDEIHTPVPTTNDDANQKVWSPIQQGLVNNSPDVDAIWRLVMDRPFTFENNQSVYLLPGNWCPFNTQSTWWWPVAYPLLYIPSYCSFRMCDIWKSFVAQRCLWELNAGITFHAPEVVQKRNVHNLMHDFHDEIPGYEKNDEIISILKSLELESGDVNITRNIKICYETLVRENIFPEDELDLLNVWLEDVKKCFTTKVTL